MSENTEKEYVSIVVESARQMWGDEEFKKIKEQVERTAKAVYSVSNYPLESGIEPLSLPRLKEE